MSPDNPLFQLKQELKNMIPGIRTIKGIIKSSMSAASKSDPDSQIHKEAHDAAGSAQWKLYGSLKPGFRHAHIAYCELRGTAREDIERPAEGNEPDEAAISQVKSHYGPLLRDWLSKKASDRSRADIVS